MTSAKNRSNSSKEEKSPPGGGTSNAGNKSPSDSSLFSEGVFINKDIKPTVNTDPSDETYATYEHLEQLLNTLPPQHIHTYMSKYAEQAGLTLSKPLSPHPDWKQHHPDSQTYYPDAYNNPKVSHPGMDTQMFNGRETPMTTGFSPAAENFSQRSEPPLNEALTSFAAPSSSTHPVQPAPTGTPSNYPSNYPSSDFPTNTTFQQPAVGNRFIHPQAGTTNTTFQQPTPPALFPEASIPGPTFHTGLALRANPRPDQYVNYENNRIIIPRDKRGSTDKEKVKMHEICTEAITPRITRGNIAKLLSSTDESYDIATDAAQWQSALHNIWDHVVKFDYTHIVYIPASFDPTNPNSIGAHTTFVNSVLDHDQLTDNHYFSWQTLIRRFGQREEQQSDAWLEDKLWNSVDSDLKAEVMSTFNDLHSTQKGSISLLRLIINRIVQNSQESRRAMEEYIKSFDIRKFSGEDVTKASLRIKAVAQSLGTTKLPTDIVHRVLEGFAHSSTPAFSQLCHHQESMISSSLVKSTLRQDTLYKTLIAIMNDLEIKYLELLSGNRWYGLGNSTPTPTTAFFTNTADADSDDPDTDEYEDYMVLTARTGQRAIPFDIWVKDKTCRNCNEVGHIQHDCPKPRRSKSPHPKPNHPRVRHGLNRPHHQPRSSSILQKSRDYQPTSTPKQEYSSKVQALINAARDLAFTAHVTTPNTTSMDDITPCDDDTTSSHDYSGLLAALGCPKE